MGSTDASTGIKSVRAYNVGEGDLVTLLPSNFKRAGYGFIGWSTDPSAATHFKDNDASNDPIIYGPMEDIEAPPYPTNGTQITTMYAVWLKAEEDSNHNPLYFQDFSSSDCANLTQAQFNSTTGVITPGSVIALTDKRDDEVYAVAKLADGKCWMIENLRIEHEATVGQNKNDQSVTNASLAEGYGTNNGTGDNNYGSFIGLAKAESGTFSGSSATSNSYFDGHRQFQFCS